MAIATPTKLFKGCNYLSTHEWHKWHLHSILLFFFNGEFSQRMSWYHRMPSVNQRGILMAPIEAGNLQRESFQSVFVVTCVIAKWHVPPSWSISPPKKHHRMQVWNNTLWIGSIQKNKCLMLIKGPLQFNIHTFFWGGEMMRLSPFPGCNCLMAVMSLRLS